MMTVRQAVAVWSILRYTINQSEAETKAIKLLKKQHPDLNTVISLTMDFADLVRRKAVRPRVADRRKGTRTKKQNKLAEWLKNAEESKMRAITGFATKLKDDLNAVKNGVTYQWSNKQVEEKLIDSRCS